MTLQDEIDAMIAGVAMGDRTAFRQLYDRTASKLFGICLHIADDPGLAEDALEEVFQTVWAKAGLYRANGTTPMTWLITLTRDAALDRRQDEPPSDEAETNGQSAPWDPAVRGQGRAEAELLAACLQELPPERAVMLRRAYLEGVRYAQLADEAGMPEIGMRTVMRRNLAQLRDCLSQ
ncbi:MAG: sigma-70 family RNA polymerase sigma factor [Paracoccaceae bacterium]|nr:sigma-70 family RNA polymerase sigma factor [Paracoccaceae bacterium]